jgi:5-methyltetrahydrofolate--homocysteine methyltransferase
MSDEKRKNWRGYPELRQRAKEFRNPQTSAEEALWSALRGKKLDGLKFRRQHPIHRAIADFCCTELKLIVEVDGSVHEDNEQFIHDRVRDEWLSERGYTVIRFANEDVDKDLNSVLEQIQQKAKALSC